MLAFASILLTAIAAYAGAPLWIALLGAAVLFFLSLQEHRRLAEQFTNPNAKQLLTMAKWQSAGHAMLAGGAAYGLGLLSRLALSI